MVTCRRCLTARNAWSGGHYSLLFDTTGGTPAPERVAEHSVRHPARSRAAGTN